VGSLKGRAPSHQHISGGLTQRCEQKNVLRYTLPCEDDAVDDGSAQVTALADGAPNGSKSIPKTGGAQRNHHPSRGFRTPKATVIASFAAKLLLCPEGVLHDSEPRVCPLGKSRKSRSGDIHFTVMVIFWDITGGLNG
jgi:hypothetical protein